MHTPLPVLAALACLAAGPATALEFFPAEPGIGEKVYLIYTDFCGELPPEGRPVLTLLDSALEAWEFRFEVEVDSLCFATPPPGSSRTYAFEIPESIGGVPVTELHTVEIHSYPGGSEEVATTLWRPSGRPVPASIAGTWHSEAGREQGVLVTMDDSRALVVNFATYDAQGAKAWYSGRAWTQGSATTTIALSDTGNGVFMGMSSSDTPARPWGEIDLTWIACGKLHMAWRPVPGTGLVPGEADLMQLTNSVSAPCNLDRYAAARNGIPQYVDYDVVD